MDALITNVRNLEDAKVKAEARALAAEQKATDAVALAQGRAHDLASARADVVAKAGTIAASDARVAGLKRENEALTAQVAQQQRVVCKRTLRLCLLWVCPRAFARHCVGNNECTTTRRGTIVCAYLLLQPHQTLLFMMPAAVHSLCGLRTHCAHVLTSLRCIQHTRSKPNCTMKITS